MLKYTYELHVENYLNNFMLESLQLKYQLRVTFQNAGIYPKQLLEKYKIFKNKKSIESVKMY